MKDQETVLVGIIVQQFQPVTSKDVLKRADNLGYALDEADVIYTLENMQRRDILSIMFREKGNLREKAYGMAKPVFKKIPEVAHLKDMLPTLIKSKQAKDFLRQLEGETSDTTKKRELGYRDYKQVKIKLLTTQPIVGGSLNRPANLSPDVEKKLEDIKKKSKKNEAQEDAQISEAFISRDSQGNFIYTPNQVRQYFLKNLRIAGLGDSAVNQIYFNPAKINPNGHKAYLEQWPIIINGQGRGVKTAEALPAGVEIDVGFSFPFTGTKIDSPEKLKQILEFIVQNGVGFSSYSKKFGKCELADFRVEKMPWE